MKKLLIVGAAQNHINMDNAGPLGISQIENISLAEFRARTDFSDTIIMKGLVETSDFMRVVLALNKSLGGGFVSHCTVFRRDGVQPFVLTDAALNIAPTLRDKISITKNAIMFCRRTMGIESPVVNFITPSSKIDTNIKSSTDACVLENWVAENFPDVKTAHNAFDVCFVPDVAELKGIKNAPRPDIIVADNIDQGNAIWKSLTIFGGFSVGGFIIGNPQLPPVILTSRSDTTESKLNCIREIN